MQHHTRIRIAIAGLALVVAPTLAACGNAKEASLPTPKDQPSSAAPADTAADADRAMAAYDACMNTHGVPQQNGKPTAPVDADVLTAAMDACRAEAAALPVQQVAPDADARIMESQLKLARCMRKRGYDFPDPDPNSGSQDLGVIDNPEQFDKDQAACAQEVGLGGGMVTSSGNQ